MERAVDPDARVLGVISRCVGLSTRWFLATTSFPPMIATGPPRTMAPSGGN
jgi:hypothetical protein